MDSNANFGLRTSHWPAVDCDVTDQAIAAELRALLLEELGDTPVRVGNAPKFAIACRTDEPFKKSKIELTHPVDGSVGAIEFLGDGQQYVIAGTHPKTMAPYRWEHAGRTGGVELLEASLDRLPNLSDSVLRERLVPMIQLFAQKRGLQASSATSFSSGSHGQPGVAARALPRNAARDRLAHPESWSRLGLLRPNGCRRARRSWPRRRARGIPDLRRVECGSSRAFTTRT